MLRSMTGYGQSELSFAGYQIQFEIRSVNHRYCEILIRQPKEWNRYEDMLRKTVQQHVRRGHVEVGIQVERQWTSEEGLQINWPLLRAYMQAAQLIKDEYRLIESMSYDLTVKDLLFAPDVLQSQQHQPESEEEMGLQLRQGLLEALTQFTIMRETEGAHLRTVLDHHLGQVESCREEMVKRFPTIVSEYRQRLEQRIRDLLRDEYPPDEARLAMEVAIFADKCSIDEELARLSSHIQQFRQLMSDEEPTGRRMDFLLQEMNREANTIGSKANDAELTSYVVAMKSELEKLREQVQNIE